jgi:hypothetical protein
MHIFRVALRFAHASIRGSTPGSGLDFDAVFPLQVTGSSKQLGPPRRCLGGWLCAILPSLIPVYHGVPG